MFFCSKKFQNQKIIIYLSNTTSLTFFECLEVRLIKEVPLIADLVVARASNSEETRRQGDANK
jgi:hypothetical protein